MTGTRTCASCGRENALDVDFCACGEYLRWEPTNYQMPAIVPPPDAPAQPPAADRAPSPPPSVASPPPAHAAPPPAAHAAPPPSPPVRAAPPTPPPEAPEAHFVTAIQPAVPRRTPGSPRPPRRRDTQAPRVAPPPPPAAEAPSPAAEGPPPAAAISLGLPGEDAGTGAPGVAVVPGDRARVIALVRNQSAVVDHYSLELHGLPREWYTVMPETVYLVPFGSAGAYEQEIEIHLHPPRTPEARARRWDVDVAVVSRAYGAEVTSAPLTVGIHPYEDYAVRVRPERASGRRRAKYDVTIANNANASVMLALDASDGDAACRFDFERDTVELQAAQTRTLRLRCRPPRQIWLGRAVERRFEIACAAGEAGEQLLQAKAEAMKPGGLAGLGARMPKIPGVSAPKVGMPNVSIGPGGKIDVRRPMVRGPQFQGVNLRRPTLGLKALRMPDSAAATDLSSAPLLPTQAIFRQKPWLPWWSAIVLALLALLALMLFLLLPKNVEVPNVVGSKTVFAAEKQLVAAGLQLKDTKERVSTDDEPGTVLEQSPEAGAEVKKGAPVSLEIALSNNETIVPKLAGLTLSQADKLLRSKNLQKGTPSPSDPALTIASTIPAAGERVKEGTPIDIFYPDPKAAAKAGGKGPPGAVAVGGDGGGAKEISVPAIEPSSQNGYGAALADAGLVPVPEPRISPAKPGTVFATDPAVGTKVAKGATVTMLVSAGFPRMAYDNDENVLLAKGANGDQITPAIAKSDKTEKDPTWSLDGSSIVYTADEQLVSVDVLSRTPRSLRPATEKYGDPSFAPTTKRSVLAVSRVGDDDDRDLCFANITADTAKPRCIPDARFSVGFAHWSPDGTTILVAAREPDGRFGIVQYTSRKAFSANPDNWDQGKFVTTVIPCERDRSCKGVRDAALSPDGKHLAAVSNLRERVPRLYLTTPDDFRLETAELLPFGACKVQWLDSRNLAFVDLGNDCGQDFGTISRIDVSAPTKSSPLVTAGDNPTFQPLSAGG